jgi:hypothetical protein
MAMFGYDGVLHGPRKGASTQSTDALVFNFLNPRAARDNSLQGAADLFAVARALESFSAGGIKLDPKKMALYGHSQGGNAAALAAGYEPTFGAVVLSGTGGGLVPGILGKKKPVSVAGALPVVLGDAVDDFHPVMNLLQMYFDRSDTLNFGRRITHDPPMGSPPRHLFHLYGSSDNYSPDDTLRYFGNAAGLPVIHPVVTKMEILSTLTVIKAPVSENVDVNGTRITAVQAQYDPKDYDGHFVSTMNAGARKAIQKMLATFFRDGKPVVE